MTTYYRNTIDCFIGSWSSGLAYLQFQEGDSVPCDNGYTVRALRACFGDSVIGQAHTVNNDPLYGQDIVWSYDDYGLTLGGFTPYQDWIDRDLPEIELGESIEID